MRLSYVNFCRIIKVTPSRSTEGSLWLGASYNRFRTGSVVASIRAAALQLILSKAASLVFKSFLLYEYRYCLTERQSLD